MRPRSSSLCLVLCCFLAAAGAVPGAGQVVVVDDFEPKEGGWSAVRTRDGQNAELDPTAEIGRTKDPQKVRNGRHALTYSYRVEPSSVKILANNRSIDATGTRSLRFWLQTSHSTQVMVSFTERSGAVYRAAFYAESGAWQDVALNFEEFRLETPGKDPNGKLDLDQLTSLGLMDAGCLLVNLAADIQGARIMYLDDLRFSSIPAAETTGPAQLGGGRPAFRVDTFESGTIRWTPLSVELDNPLRIMPFHQVLRLDDLPPAMGGAGCLRMTYPRETGRAVAMIRDLEREDIGKATAVSLSLRTSRDGPVIVGLEEKDGSRYQTTIELKTSDQWRQYSFLLSAFELANDSQDENNKLDAAQIKNLSLVDFAGLLGADLGSQNTLRVDEVYFLLAE